MANDFCKKEKDGEEANTVKKTARLLIKLMGASDEVLADFDKYFEYREQVLDAMEANECSNLIDMACAEHIFDSERIGLYLASITQAGHATKQTPQKVADKAKESISKLYFAFLKERDAELKQNKQPIYRH